MTNRAGLFPIVLMAALLLAPAMAWAAEEPVATAPIPPPLPAPDTPMMVPSFAAPPAAAAPQSAKKPGRAASHTRVERKTAAHAPSTHRKIVRPLVAHAYPPPPPMPPPPHYYPGAFASGPAGGAPPMPPPWYDRGRPLAFYPYPGPHGPAWHW